MAHARSASTHDDGNRQRRAPGPWLAGVATVALALLMAAFSTPPRMPADDPQLVQIARDTTATKHLRKLDDSDDSGAGMDKSWAHSTGAARSGVKTAPGGYNSEHIRNFWRHYHGARPEPKSKPLER